MRRLGVALLLLAGCPGGGGARPVVPLDPPATDAAVAAEPMPPADYVEARARVIAEADAVVALIDAGDADGIFARFNAGMAEAVPLPQVKLLANAMKGQIAERTGVRAVPMSPRVRTYVANAKISDATLALAMAFDDEWKIAGIQFSPVPAVPEPGPGAPVALGFPAPGTWLVFWGGDDPRDNYHVVVPQQRHAYDLVVWKDGATFRGDGTKNADYHCFGVPIEAPLDARVTAVVADLPDNEPGKMDPAHAAGNHVMLEVGPSRYLMLAHLQAGSVQLQVGDQVRRGAQVGRCGNSGNTSEPHLHVHLQDKPGFADAGARGLPLSFADVVVDGARVPVSAPVRGRFVKRATP